MASMKNRLEVVGENLKRLRLERGWTQEEVARMAGVSQGYYSAIEAGKKWWGSRAETKWAKVFNVEWTEFYRVEDDEMIKLIRSVVKNLTEFERRALLGIITGLHQGGSDLKDVKKTTKKGDGGGRTGKDM